MSISTRHWIPLLLLAASIVAAGCSSDSDSDSETSGTTGQLRLANATASGQLALNAVGVTDDDETASIGAIASGTVSDYEALETQSYTIGVSETTGALVAATDSVYVSEDVDYTLLGFERLGSVATSTIVDNQLEPSSGFTSLAIANTAGDAGSVDVYLVAPGQALNGASATFSTVGTKSTTTAKSLTSGTYDIVVTASGKPADRRLTLSSVTLSSGDCLTLALTPTVGGGLLNGALLEQEGSLVLHPATTARVRLVGAFAAEALSNSIVRASIGATSLAAVTSPSAGSYTLVEGDTWTWSVTVDGVAVGGLPTIEFENGGDYTVLAYGSPAAPAVAVFEDSNQPSSTGAANMRLVNAAVSGGLTLTTDYVPINSDVAYGTAAEYSPATSSSAALLQITSPVASFPTYTASDVRIASGGVYTLFVLGSTTAPVVVFAKDR